MLRQINTVQCGLSITNNPLVTLESKIPSLKEYNKPKCRLMSTENYRSDAM